MVRSSFRLFFQLLGGMTLIVAVTVAAIGWKLSQGPLVLNFLTPYIEQALSAEDGGYRIKVDGTELSWAGWRRTLDLKAMGLTATDADGNVLAAVPELYLRLSGKALVQGMIAPKTVELRATRVRVNRTASGAFEFGLGETQADDAGGGNFMASLVGELLAEPDLTRPTGHLSRVLITDARVLVTDATTGQQWEATRVDLDLQRDEQGIAGEGSISLNLPDETARIEVVAAYNSKIESLDLGISFDKIQPAGLAQVVPVFEPAKALDLPLSGTIALTVSKDGHVDSIGFDIIGEKGTLSLPDPLAVTYPIAKIAMTGQIGKGLTSVDLSSLFIDLGGPTVNASAEVRGLGTGDITIKTTSKVENLPMDLLATYWPPSIGSEAHAWVAHNLSDGMIPLATYQIDLAGPTLDKLGVVVLDGKARADGVSVGYIDGMPKVRNGSAHVDFSPDEIVIHIEKGTVEGLTATGGYVRLFGLSQYDQFADIELKAKGPVPNALGLIDYPPLGFASELGIDPKKTSGDAEATAKLDFPLLKTLKMADVQVKAKAKVSKAGVADALFGKSLSEGRLDLEVDNKGMQLGGTAKIGAVPAHIDWKENFAGGPQRSQYKITGVLDKAARESFGLVIPENVSGTLDGAVKADLSVTMDGEGRGALGGQFDLQDAMLELPGFEWEKPLGVPGAASVSMRFSDSGVLDIPRIAVSVPERGLEVLGAMRMTADRQTVRSMHLDKFIIGRTEVAGELRINDDGSRTIEVTGPRFDAMPFLQLGKNDTGALTGVDTVGLPPISAHIEVDRVWVGPDRFFSGVIADLVRDNDRWHTLNLTAEITDGRPLRIGITPFETVRDFSMTCDDAGALLRTFGFYNNMEGGVLDVQGTIDSIGTITGQAQINDFKVRQAPVLARLLTIASLTGFFDLLQGEGITFTQFDMPFGFTNGLLTTQSGRAYGPAIGITFSGHADMETESFDVDGEIVPSYTLNSLLGNIPLLGRIFSGEKGGGLFGVNYSVEGTVDKPVITVNPLSALTPGFLRNIFNIFDTGPSTEDLIKEKTKDTAPAPNDPPPVTVE